MHNLSYLFILVCVGVCYAQQPCISDYQCGNTLPYKYCDKAGMECTATVNGFAITNSSIYYIQQCNSNAYLPAYQYGNYTVKRIPIDGGLPQDIYTRFAYPAPGNPAKVLGIANDLLFFSTYLRQPGVGLVFVNVANAVKEEYVYPGTPGFLQSAADFDAHSTSPATYMCSYNIGNPGNYSIERFPVPTSGGYANSKSSTVYTFPESKYCSVIKRYSDVDLFFTGYIYNADFSVTTSVYRGSITCSNCAPPQPLFSVNEQIIDLDVSGNYVFYGTATGLYRINMDGTGSIKLSGGNEQATGVHIVGSSVIFNNGMDIKKVDFSGNNVMVLSKPSVGKCSCRTGFTGSDCTSCAGQVQWQSTSPSHPACIPVGAGGVPTICTQDFQCLNPPFTTCLSNKCTCQTNFTGAMCNVCDSPRQVSWSYGYPQCA